MAEKKNVSFLEQSLSLDEHGGIYYAGARVPADDKHAVLFVGLGGSGADAIIRIKDQITNRMILPVDDSGCVVSDVPRNIGFLEFDTDDKTEKIKYGNAKFAAFGTEFKNINVDGLPAVIQAVKVAKEGGKKGWEWFDDNVNAVAGADGAGGIRQLGRLLLAWNIDKIVDAISQKITSLLEASKAKDLRVFLFSGMAGGTGAGTFLDMAYIIQQEAEKKTPNVNVMGYLIMPDVNEMNGGNVQKLRSNGYACLKELDYWMSTGEHAQPYVQNLNGYMIQKMAKPFTFCHLLNSTDIQGHIFSYDKILRTVAENVFAYVAGEVGGDGGTSAMTSMYNNIQGYIQIKAASSPNPATYQYLSIGSDKIEIPYTDISTYLGGKVFEKLKKSVLCNRPNKDSFERYFHMLGFTLQGILAEIDRHMPLRPSFVNIKYNQIWPQDMSHPQAVNWLSQLEKTAAQFCGGMPADLEGRMKEFIKNNMVNYETGPVFLKYFLKSNESFNVYSALKNILQYCNEMVANHTQFESEAKKNMIAAYNKGSNPGVFGKDIARKEYISALESWMEEYRIITIYSEIQKIYRKLIERVDIYYNNVLKQLADVMEELPLIFEKNMEIIRVEAQKPRPDVLMTPLEFEKNHRNVFNQAVEKAEKAFLSSLAANVHRWIGRDVDGVDENIVGGTIDVPGFISQFISQNFSQLLTINLENILTTKLTTGQTLDNYVRLKIDALLESSYTMFKKAAGCAANTDYFAILSVPRDCPNILQSAKNHIQLAGLSQKIIIKESDEKSRFYIVKVESGFPLYLNHHINELEKAYEEVSSDKSTFMGIHSIKEWKEEGVLPTPYQECCWNTGYVSARTKKFNDKFRALFDKCVDAKIIEKNDVDQVYLKISDDSVKVSQKNLTAPTLNEKNAQLQKIKQQMWENGSSIELSTCSTYGDNDKLKNVRENMLRFPHLQRILKVELEKWNQMLELEDYLKKPRYFAQSLVNEMIREDDYTGDVDFVRYQKDPFPIKLCAGENLQVTYPEFVIYSEFDKVLTDEIKPIIETQNDNRKERIKGNDEELRKYIEGIQKWMNQYEECNQKVVEAIRYAVTDERARLLVQKDFLDNVIEELHNMIPKKMQQPQPQPVPSPAPVPTPAEGSWKCSCGTVNTTKFCMECGSPKPAPKPAGESWTCHCGTVNTTKFCMECGSPKPAPKPAGESWTCHCGTVNTTKFCMECGSPKPAPKPAGESWKCSCGTVNTTKFCMECGSPRPAQQTSWTCSCGTVNTTKFCMECGSPRPAQQTSWTCSCGSVNTGKFCMNCGSPRN